VLFDKDNIIQYKNVDNIELSQKILKHIKIQKDLVWQSERIQTYINRNNYIEATNYYIKFMYLPLVGILRVKYTPRLYNWWRIHISRHFSPEIVMKLEDLMKLNSIQDIEGNLEKSRRWFIELIAEIESE
jgi:hypothetical protein